MEHLKFEKKYFKSNNIEKGNEISCHNCIHFRELIFDDFKQLFFFYCKEIYDRVYFFNACKKYKEKENEIQ